MSSIKTTKTFSQTISFASTLITSHKELISSCNNKSPRKAYDILKSSLKPELFSQLVVCVNNKIQNTRQLKKYFYRYHYGYNTLQKIKKHISSLSYWEQHCFINRKVNTIASNITKEKSQFFEVESQVIASVKSFHTKSIVSSFNSAFKLPTSWSQAYQNQPVISSNDTPTSTTTTTVQDFDYICAALPNFSITVTHDQIYRENLFQSFYSNICTPIFMLNFL